MRGELYEYNGEMLSQADIAKKEGINRQTLSDWYKKTKNMVDAVAGAKESQKQRNINYNGEILSLKAIAVKEKVKFESLKKFWIESEKDIYLAVQKTKEAQAKRNGDILYKGKMMTAFAIANMEDLDAKSLRRHIATSNSIEEAVEKTKKARDLHRGTIEYHGEIMSISGIAIKEGIKGTTLKEYYELYGNIDKAVFITKEAQNKRKQALLRGKKASYEDLSKYFGISTIKLEKLLEKGYTPEQIEKKIKKGVKKEEQLKINEDSLYRYCLDNSYNYWVINNLIKTYGKTPEEAIKFYLENGQQVPTKWIYEKYNILFKHLMLNFGIDSNRVIKIMKENNFGIEQALEELVFITENDNNGYKLAEISWLKECYSFLKDLPQEELEEAKVALYIDDREMRFLSEKGSKIELIRRQLLLFEFSQILDEWPEEEINEMMDLYGLSNSEKSSIILDLYIPFKNQVINPTDEYIKRQELIKKKILDESFEIKDLTELEKMEIINKRKKLLKIFSKETKDNLSHYENGTQSVQKI